MNKKMKALALLLVGIMSVGTMTACSGEPAAETPAADDSKPVAEAPADAAKEENKETVNLVWWTIGAEPKELAAVVEEANKYTAEKIGVTVDIKYASWGEYGEKLSKIVQSGESYDMAFGAGINNYQDLASKGYFADLSELVPTVAPALWDFIPEELWQGMTISNKIIGVPAYKDSAQAQYWVWDKELVEKLGIDYENINTLEELEPALKKIKENDPSKYPLVLQGLEGINGFMVTINKMDELLTKPYVSVSFDDPSATVVSPWEQEGVMNNLRILHKWFNEGLINPDAATLTETPKYKAVSAAQGYPHADADWSRSSEYPVVSHKFFGPGYSTRTIQGSFIVVSEGSKHKEEAVKYIELINTDKYLRNLLAFGIEDQHYKKTGENTIEVLNDGYGAPAYSQGTFFNMYVTDPAPAEKWTDLQKQLEESFSSPALGFTFNTEKVNNQVAACANIQAKYEPSLITGSVNPDEVVPKMLEELNKAGYQDILAEAQAQLDAYLGK